MRLLGLNTILFFITSLLFHSSTGFAHSSKFKNQSPSIQISEEEYKDIKYITESILTRFPSKDYHYLALGRSPTPILAYMELMNVDGFSMLPASRVSWVPKDAKLIDDLSYILKHLQDFMPDEKILARKKILLIDVIQNGNSLFKARELLNQFIFFGNKVESLAIIYKEYDPYDETFMANHKLHYNSRNQALRFTTERYDNFALYGFADFRFPRELYLVKKNINHSLIIDALKSCQGLFDGI